MHENIIHGSFHDPYEQHDYQDFFALSMENTCHLEKADKMSVINTFIDQDVNSMINDPIKKYPGCWQQNKHYFPDFL